MAGQQNEDEQHNPASAVSDELRQALEGKVFDSLEEANVFIESFMERRNQAPSSDFQGLSPEQMHSLIAFPFDSPQLVTVASTPEESLAAPIMRLFAMLVDAIGEQGLKPTATGNLPRNFVRASALAYLGEERY